MNLLFYAGSSGTIASGYRKTAAVLLRRAGRLINNWVAATIAHREREVVKAMLPDGAAVPVKQQLHETAASVLP